MSRRSKKDVDWYRIVAEVSRCTDLMSTFDTGTKLCKSIRKALVLFQWETGIQPWFVFVIVLKGSPLVPLVVGVCVEITV